MKTFTKPLEGPIPPIQVKWRFRQARKGWDHMGSRRRHLAKTQFCCLAPCFRNDDLSSSSLSECLFTKRIPKKHTKLSQIAKQTEHTNTRARVHMIYTVFKECKKVHTVKMFIIKYIMYPNYTVYKYIYINMYITYFTLYYIIYIISVKESSIVQQRGNARKPSQAHKPQSGWDQLSSWSLLWPWLEENTGHEEVCLHVSTVSWNILNILWHHGLETSQTIESVILVTLEICIPASGHNLGRPCPGHHDHPALQRDVAIIGDGLK